MRIILCLMLLLIISCSFEERDYPEEKKETAEEKRKLSVLSFSPAPGSSISGTEPVVAVFSGIVSEKDFTENFSMEPSAEFTVRWRDGNRSVEIIPDDCWERRTVLKFRFFDEDFILYGKGAAHPSEIIYAAVALNDGKDFPVLSENLDTMRHDDALLLRFSHVESKSETENALVFDPAVDFRSLWHGEKTLVLILEAGWKCGEKYRVSHEGKTFVFSPDIPFLELDEIRGAAADGFPVSVYDRSTPLSVETDGTYTFGFIFGSEFRTAAEKENVFENISLKSVFPPDAGNPAVNSVRWITDRSLQIGYRGFSQGGTWYEMRLQGGENGICNSGGSFLKEDISLVLITK